MESERESNPISDDFLLMSHYGAFSCKQRAYCTIEGDRVRSLYPKVQKPNGNGKPKRSRSLASFLSSFPFSSLWQSRN